IVKLAKASKNQGDPKKMAPPPKEVEEDSEDEEMSEDEDDDSSEEEVIIPQKKGKRATATSAKKVVVAVATPSKKAAVTPGKKAAATPAKKMVTSANAVVTPGKKGATQGSLVATPGKEGAATPAKGAKDGKNAKTEDSDDEEDDSKEDDEDDDEEEEEFERAVIKAAAIRLVSKDAKSKGIAYIEFKTEADAEKTFEEKQGTEIDGRSISLYYTGEKGQSQDYRSGKNSKWSGESKTLVLAGLQQKKLQEVFEKAALIKVPQNQNGKSKGYAFIESASFEDAKEALNSRNKREIEGRAIRLALQAPRGSPNAGSQGLSEGTTEETLRESLDGSVHAGTVTDRETGSAKGFGFVDFNSEEDAKTAKEAMEDDEMDGNKVTLEWDKRKGEAGFGGRGGGRGGQGGFGGRGRGGFGGHGGFRGGGGGDHEPQGKKTKSE
uniref:Nucleolin n=1 Tax=Microcebus murinus TaxID=30608 RepID=A0A8C5W9P2_MICMU